MKLLSEFSTRIGLRIGGCPIPVIEQAVLDTCIDFCNRSLVVKRIVDPFNTVANTLEYDLDSGIAKIMRVWCGTTELTPVGEDDIDKPFGFVKSIAGEPGVVGVPRYFIQTSPGVIAFYPLPDAAYVITMRVALKPLRSATQVEDELYEDWMPTIVHGALGELYLIPGEFTSTTLAKFHMEKYEEGINLALLEASRGVTRSQLRIAPVRV